MQFPYLPLWVGDYEVDTSHLTLAQDGAYTRLLRLCWRSPNCSIPDDPDWIRTRMRVDMKTYVEVVDPILREFFHRRHNRWMQKRLTQEWLRVSEQFQKKSHAGILGARAKALKRNASGSTNEQPMNKQSEPYNKITNSSILSREKAEVIRISDELHKSVRKW